MGVIKDRHGTFYVRKKVLQKLEAEVAKITGATKARVAWIQRSLGTKDARKANLLAKPVMMEIDRILATAEASLKPRPLRSNLTDQEIRRIAAYHYASVLAEDEEHRRGDLEDTAEYGLSDRRFRKLNETVAFALTASEGALAQGDISAIRHEVDELLDVHGFRLERSSEAYRKLGNAVLQEHVRDLRAQVSRSEGNPVDTPHIGTSPAPANNDGSTKLRERSKAGQRPASPPRLPSGNTHTP